MAHPAIARRARASTIAPMECDVLIIGGGAAALWLLADLRARGLRALLLAEGALGGTQSLASQGIIHGGFKYRLGGESQPMERALRDMPAAWEACLSGHAAPRLSSTRLLARELVLWPDRGRGATGTIAESVLDVPSLVANLARDNAHAIRGIDWREARFLRGADGRVLGVGLAGALALNARCTLLCAGAGNADLLQRLDLAAPAMQRRPLHQVLLQHPSLPAFFGHCIGTGARPRITITSHTGAHGERTWYLGGELAERGAERSESAQIAAARAELARQFPRLSLEGAAWRTLRVERAEPAVATGHRPDEVFAESLPAAPGAIVAWPVKLALLPRLAQRVASLLGAPGASAPCAASTAPAPALALAPWERPFT